MIWNNPISNMWYAVEPAEASIVFDGSFYNLRMKELGVSFLFQSNSLQEAQDQYNLQVTSLLSVTVTLVPHIPSVSLPADGQIIAIATVDKLFSVGMWSSSGENVTVSAAVIPLSKIITWSPLVAN